MLVAANVAVKFRRTGRCCRPPSRRVTTHSFHFQRRDSRRKLNGFKSTRHTALPRDAARVARRVSCEHRRIALQRRVAIVGTDRQTDRQGGPVTAIYRPVSPTTNSVDRFLARPTVPQQVHESPLVYGTRRFITVLSTARHLFLS